MSAAADAPVGMLIDAATRAAIVELCRRYHVRRLDIFGSAVREDFDPAPSDVDVLVAFEPGARIGMFGYVEFADALEALFGRRVDLVSDESLKNPYLRREVEADRRALFPPT
jgi:uncharacterized protein